MSKYNVSVLKELKAMVILGFGRADLDGALVYLDKTSLDERKSVSTNASVLFDKFKYQN